MSRPITFTRADIPTVSMPDYPHEVGGQWEWNWAVALPYRVLAAPQSHLPMPAAPTERRDFMDYLGYWAALQSLLTYSFGWTRHDRGLLWWFENEKPTEDPRFELIAAIWDRDGMLERYFEWCATQTPTSPLREWALKFDDQPLEVPREWMPRLAAIRAELAELEKSGTFGHGRGGTTPHGKHLEAGDHISAPGGAGLRETGSGEILSSNRTTRRAVFRQSGVDGWYRHLALRGAELPDLGLSSWRVDVFVDTIGFLGTFRRSRVTGLWFAGRHLIHTVGN
jgi:hypothetical protein